MPTYSNTFPFDMSVSTNFQVLMGQIDTEILAFGWVHSTDTGQVAIGSAAYPGTGADAGYVIYKTNDGGTTIYMKIIYGVGSGSATQPSLKVSFGTGSNGSGTLTGQTVSAQTVAYNAANSGTHRIYMSGDAGRLMIYLADSNQGSNLNAAISMHRSVDGTGAVTNTGYVVFYCIASSTFKQQYIPLTGTVPAIEGNWVAAFPPDASNVVGTTIMTGHPITWDASGGHNPTPAVAVGGITDFATGSPGNTATIPLYSVNRTFLISAETNPLNAGTSTRSLWLYD
jgi:hypothetical protein